MRLHQETGYFRLFLITGCMVIDDVVKLADDKIEACEKPDNYANPRVPLISDQYYPMKGVGHNVI